MKPVPLGVPYMHMHVLVAEDDRITREGLAEVLESEGLGAILASDGLQAWDLYQQHQPDFVCLDVMMPGISGYEVCKRIRAANPQVPVVFITAKGEEVDKVVGLELGGDDYIVKPFGVKEVVARIRAVARRCLVDYQPKTSDSLPITTFTMGDLLINPRELRGFRGETTVDLSLRELKILSVLYRSAGQVVDRNTLMNAAWNQNYLPSSRTLDQHISQLRKRIEVDSKNPRLIQTVHGVGYRYEP
ncbi:MAG: response regulator transcription factor [Pirellulaceae bacterium]